jgi:pSer/pThr/pTyr-binding forkhead associated (FHA) protein
MSFLLLATMKSDLASSAQHSYLTIHGGSRHGVVVHIRKSTTTVGRHHDSDVVIDDPSISRRHAEITYSGDGYFVSDLGSKNGTFVNQDNIGKSQHSLVDGDEITFGPGEIALTFQNSNLADVVLQDSKVTEALRWNRLVEYRQAD